MPEYVIEQYELHVMEHTVEAGSLVEALHKLSEGDTSPGAFDYVQIPEERGANGIREVMMPSGKVIDGQDPKGKQRLLNALSLAAAMDERKSKHA